MQFPADQHERDATEHIARAPRNQRLNRWRFAGLAALLFAATLLTYAHVWDAEFIGFDDGRHLAENGNLNPPSWSGLARIWTDGEYLGVYVPLAYTVFAAEAKLAQWCSDDGQSILTPWVYHVGNLLLHATCVVLVFAVLRRLVEDDVSAALAAFLFAVHPLQIESAAWISETRGTLAGVFSFTSIYGYIRFVEPAGKRTPDQDVSGATGSRPQRWPFYAVAIVAYVLALLSKPSSVSVPLMLAVIDVGWFRRRLWQTALALVWWLLPAAALAVTTSSAQAYALAHMPFHVAWWQRPLVAADALDFYLLKLVAPWHLAIDYGRTPPVALASWTVFVAWALPLALACLLWMLPQRRVWLTAAGIFVAGLAPVLGFVTFGFQEISTVGDRYVYLAMLGPALALAWLLGHVLRGAFRVELALGLAALAVYSAWYSSIWHDTRQLFTHTLEVNENSVTAYNALAVTHIVEGDYDAAERLLRRAREVEPHDSVTLARLGLLYLDRQRLDEAEAELLKLLEVQPDHDKARLYLGIVAMHRGDSNAAIERFSGIVEDDPQRLDAHYHLGLALAKSGRYAESIEHWRVILSDHPENVTVQLLLGESLWQAGDVDGAREAFRAVLAIWPDNRAAGERLRQIESQWTPQNLPN